MSDPSPVSSARRWWRWVVVGSLTVVAVALVLVNTSRHGVGISPDSTGYLAAARSLLAGRGYTGCDGAPLTAWPPLFPTLLAGLGLAGIEPALGARLLNALAFGVMVFLSGRLFNRTLRSPPLAVIATATVALFFPLIQVASMAWTEPVFVLLITLFVLQGRAYQRRPRLTSLGLLALLAALCSLQRYAGVAIIMAGFILVLLPTRGDSRANRLKALVCFAVIACTPLALWMVRNYALTSTFSGHPRIPSIYSLGQNVLDAIETVTAWFVPDAVALETRGPVMGILMLLVAAALALRLYDVAAGDSAVDGLVVAAIVVTLVYLPFILYTHQIAVRDEIMNDRYLVPVSIAMLWCMFLALDGLQTLLELLPRRSAWTRHLVPVLCALWLIYPVTQVVGTVRQGLREGAGGYSRTDWQTLPFVQWLREHPLAGRVYSNAPDAYYALVDPNVRTSPERWMNLDDVQRSVSGQPVDYLVWFGNLHREAVFDRDELTAGLYLEEIAAVWNSGVYRMRPSTELAFEGNRIFTDCLIHGTWSRTFTSDQHGHRGVIGAWLMNADGTTDSLWQLDAGDGRVLRWSASGPFTQTDGAFEFQCEGTARETRQDTTATCTLRVDGAVDGNTAAGTYRVTFDHPEWPPADRGTWSVRLARPVYLMYSHATGRHLFTLSRQEVQARARPGSKEWADGSVAFHVYPEGTQPPGAAAVFGFSSPDPDVRFYTMDTDERDRLRDDDSGAWRYEGVAWYAFSEDECPPDARPVHRFWSDAVRAHFYTIDEDEKDKLVSDASLAWVYEGVAWYAIPPEPRRETTLD